MIILKRLTTRFINSVTLKMKIGTHDGCFHADEALACFMLKQLPEYANAEIIRTRNEKELSECDLVVDVGNVYDPSKHKYDHHQSSFTDTMQTLRPELKSTVRLSSAGLIYHHFGERIFEAILDKKLEKTYLTKLFSYVYFHFVQELDGVDNGVPLYDSGEPRYLYHTDLSSRVANLSPGWNQKTQQQSSELFEKAMELTGKEFTECVNIFSEVWWPARSLVEEAINNRFTTHPSGEIIEIPGCPWLSHLFEIEKEQGIEGVIKFGLFQDENKNWRTRSVPLTPGNFLLRIPLHEKWRGLRNEELQAKSQIADAIFVHNTGFIGGAVSKEGALALAIKTIQLQQN